MKIQYIEDKTPNMNVIEQFAIATMLCYHSKIHSEWTIHMAAQHLYFPIAHQQIRFWHSTPQNAIAFLTWAWMSPEYNTKMQHRNVYPASWHSGSQLWLMDFICPFGGAAQIVREFPKMFPGETAFWWRIRADGSWKFHSFSAAVKQMEQ